MNEQLTTSEPNELMPVNAFAKSFDSLLKVSGDLLKSGMLPEGYKTPQQVAMAIIKGRELNLPAMAALQGLYPVGRKLGMEGHLMLALIRRSGELEKFELKEGIEPTNPSITCTMKRKSTGEEQSWTFSLSDARRAGLIKPGGNYDKWTKNMLNWRAIANVARLLFSDITDGMHMPAELDPMQMVDAEFEDSTSTSEYKPDPSQSFKTAQDALIKAKKSQKIEDLNNWHELYADDVRNLPENMRNILIRDFKISYDRIKPVEVKDVATTSQGIAPEKTLPNDNSTPVS